MYFANNPVDKSFCSSMVQAFFKEKEKFTNLRMHALVDAAFDEYGFAQLMEVFTAQAIPVYADTLYSGAMEVGPHLIEINISNSRDAEDEVNQLLALRANRPMLSFVITPLDANGLAKNWCPFVSAQLEDASIYMLRFADTRVLYSLISVLTPEQFAHFLPEKTQIWMPARSGHRITTESKASPSSSFLPQLVLSNRQFNELMNNAEPDAVIERLTQEGSKKYAAVTGADLHEFVKSQIQRASNYYITQTPDLVTYCELAWTMGADFDQDPEVNIALLHVTPAHRLLNVLPGIPQMTWDRLDAKQRDLTGKKRQS